MKKAILFALLAGGLIGISVVLILFSWLPDPLLSKLGWLPDGVGRWADHPDNINIRTAVPMVVWGFFAGMILYFKKAKRRWWFISGITGISLVAMAELGQIWIPNRHPDWSDVAWGCLGIAAGLLAIRLFARCLPGVIPLPMKAV